MYMINQLILELSELMAENQNEVMNDDSLIELQTAVRKYKRVNGLSEE